MFAALFASQLGVQAAWAAVRLARVTRAGAVAVVAGGTVSGIGIIGMRLLLSLPV